MSHTYEKLPKKIQVILRLPIITALISFVIGTTLFLLYWMTFDLKTTVFNQDISLPIIGLFYVVIAFVFNGLLLAALIIFSFIYRHYQFTILKYAAVILINIPITILYIYLLFNYDNYAPAP